MQPAQNRNIRAIYVAFITVSLFLKSERNALSTFRCIIKRQWTKLPVTKLQCIIIQQYSILLVIDVVNRLIHENRVKHHRVARRRCNTAPIEYFKCQHPSSSYLHYSAILIDSDVSWSSICIT